MEAVTMFERHGSDSKESDPVFYTEGMENLKKESKCFIVKIRALSAGG